jgi:hypothetical protein
MLPVFFHQDPLVVMPCYKSLHCIKKIYLQPHHPHHPHLHLLEIMLRQNAHFQWQYVV